jgi:6-phosphogluconolactonase
MHNLTRREFIVAASASTAALTTKSFAEPHPWRVLIGSNTPEGILGYSFNYHTGELTPTGVAAKLANVDWLISARTKDDQGGDLPKSFCIFACSEVDTFNGKPTGGVVSYLRTDNGVEQIFAVNSAGKGTCHIALDHTGSVLLSADYGGGSAASFKVLSGGHLSQAIWTEHYHGSGPRADRQESAHAHFASFSPDNYFAFINDLGSDCIHIYRLNAATAELTKAGEYKSRPGAGPRTLHFHPNGSTAYCVNELDSTVDVLAWNPANASFTLINRIELLTPDMTGLTRACDAVISHGGFVYFANRDHNFLYSFSSDPKTGALTPIARTSCGGKTPRNFTLDPTERWMLVANQDSDNITVFARDPKTGALANEGKSYPAPAPMRILFS